jgi:lambda repressor-like predicted transcriptional regulator
MKIYEIKGHLTASNSGVIKLAKKIGVSQSAVSRCLHRDLHSKKIEQAIANQINKPLEVVFPEYKK